MTYTIRRGTVTLCSSALPNCGYPASVLKDMSRAGMYLYRDGKRMKQADVERQKRKED